MTACARVGGAKAAVMPRSWPCCTARWPCCTARSHSSPCWSPGLLTAARMQGRRSVAACVLVAGSGGAGCRAAGQQVAAPQQGPDDEQELAAAGQRLLHGAQSAQEICSPAGAQALHILSMQVHVDAAHLRAVGAAPSLLGCVPAWAEEQCVPGAWPPELRKPLPGVVRAALEKLPECQPGAAAPEAAAARPRAGTPRLASCTRPPSHAPGSSLSAPALTPSPAPPALPPQVGQTTWAATALHTGGPSLPHTPPFKPPPLTQAGRQRGRCLARPACTERRELDCGGLRVV
jgi:hypothetical protein